ARSATTASPRCAPSIATSVPTASSRCSTCSARSTRRRPPMATSGVKSRSSAGSAPTRRSCCARRPACNRESLRRLAKGDASRPLSFLFGHHCRMPTLTLDDLRRYAVSRSLFAPTTLPAAIRKLGFVQADPIRAPARAQDLTLRHRVKDYRVGELERRYPRLDVEEDYFVNYGFVPSAVQSLMHPRTARKAWSPATRKRAEAVLGFIREQGEVHPREVDEQFSHGRVTNAWGGSSSATTHLLDGMHYRGMLRVVRREGGIRIYAARELAHRERDD